MPRHVIQCPIRWVDMDAYQHVNNTAYLRYLEEARVRMFGLADAETASAWAAGRIVIARVDIDYRRPLSFRPEPVQVVSAVTRVGRSSFDIAQQVVDADTVFAEATSTIVAVGGVFGRARSLTEDERASLASFAAAPPAGSFGAQPSGGPGPGAAGADLAEPGPARHEVDLALRWADMDVNAHVNNVTYATYLQEARAHLFALHDRGGRGPLVRGLVVVRMHIDFVRALSYRAEPVRARTWFSSVTGATITVQSEIRARDELYCRGVTKLAAFDFAANRPRRITPTEREALMRYVVRAQPLAAD